MSTARKTLFLVVTFLVVLLLAASVAMGAKPKRIMIVVMDQMKPEYAKQYNMTNVLWLQDNGLDFNKAYVGDMASETVVSHNVMVSGLFPKHMGWSDEVMRLVRPLTKDNGTTDTYPAGSIVTTGDLSVNQYKQLIEDLGYPKLGDYLHAKFPTKIVANVGQKGYQVESMAASSSDYWVRMGSTATPNGTTVPYVPGLPGKYRPPRGSLPSYIATPFGNRFWISSGNDDPNPPFIPPADYYGTKVDKPAWLYPEDGRYVKGPYAGHESGDIWVAEAALAIMDNEQWSGLWVTFSAIDKVGHMWGGGAVDTLANYGWDPNSIFREVHMPWAAKNADDQLGRLIQKLKDKGLFNDTLIVLTADHGSTYADSFNGVDKLNGATTGWYYDPNNTCVNTTFGRAADNNATVLAPLNADGNLAYSYQSTAIEAWLINQSWDKKVVTAGAMEDLPGVIATYIRDGDHYVLFSSSDTMTASEYSWWAARGQELVDTMAFDGAADVVGLLADKTSYAAFGDHGGAQMDVQRIPMTFYAKGMQKGVRGTKFRLVDIAPTILRNMGIPQIAPMDGTAYNLNIK